MRLGRSFAGEAPSRHDPRSDGTGTLPTGINLDPATGVLSGTPTQTGSFPITVTATDSNGCAGNQAYTLTVVDSDLIFRDGFETVP